jgi:hypothetical protein
LVFTERKQEEVARRKKQEFFPPFMHDGNKWLFYKGKPPWVVNRMNLSLL